MIAYSKDQKKLVVPASLGNFASDAPVSGGVTPEEVQAMIDSSLTSYDETVQGYIADTNVDVEENAENISTLSGLTSGISSDVEALSAVTAQNAQDIQDLSAYTATIQSGEMNDEAIILYTANANIDALYEEIAAAYNAGKTVFLRGLNTDNEITILRLIADYTDSFSFTGTSVKGSDTSGIKTYAVSIWKYGDNPAGMNGVQNGKFVPETIISNYQLLPASASWLGGVKVGSGLSIDENGVLSTSGDSGNIVILEFTGDGSQAINALGAKLEAAYNAGKDIFLKGKNSENAGYVVLPFYSFTHYADNPRYYFRGLGSTDSNNSAVTYNVYLQKSAATGNWAIGGTGRINFTAVSTISNYTLPTAAANTLGGVKVGSGLTIDGNGVLSVSGGSSDSNYVVVEALSAITNPVEGMVAYVPDKTVQYSNVQVITLSNTEGEGFDDYAGWINFNGVDVREIFQGGGGLKFYFDYGNSGKWMKLRGEYEGQQYTQLYRTHNDSQPSIEISAPLDLVGVDFTITPNTSHPSITTASTFNNFSLKEDGGIYRYEGSEWVRVSVPKAYNLSEMDSTARAALYSELLPYFDGKGSFATRFPAENYRFFVNASDMSENFGAIPMSLSNYGSDDGNVLFFIGATAGKWAEPVYGFRASLAPDGNLETGKYEVRNYEGLPVQNVNYFDDGDNRLIFNTSTSAFTYGHSIAEGQPIVNGNTIGGSFFWFCLKPWDGNWAIGVPRLMFLLTDGNGSETYYTCPSIKTKFIPAVTIDGIDYTIEYTGNYGEVSVRFKVNNDNGNIADLEFIEN